MATQKWTEANIASQQGKTILITGANSGLGLQASKVLAGKGANVIMAVRNLQKGEEAIKTIKSKVPNAKLELMQLDLADFNSIRKFSEAFHQKHPKLNILINNAGIMSPEKRLTTKQNLEYQFGVNHIGHFLLTGLLLDILKKTPHSRIAVQSSNAHKEAIMRPDIHFDDLNFEKAYNRYHTYGQSKLANLLWAYELDRRLKAHNIDTIVAAAHPGITKTNLQDSFTSFWQKLLIPMVAQKVEIGTLPILRAATDENLKGAEYFGGTKLGGLRGYPELIKSSDKSHNNELAKKLWEVSETIAGIKYNFD